jgi:hypothetical protein
MTLYPLGYDGPDPDLIVDKFVTLDELAVTLVKAHPEFRRRVLAAIEAAAGVVGIGGGWRSTATQTALFLSRYVVDPAGSIVWNGQHWSKKPGVASAAPPGSSFHESQLFASGIWGFQAVDIVGKDPSGHVAAQAWMHANGKQFGLKDFANVNSEPWHIQCVGLPNSVAEWKSIGSPDPATPTPPKPQPPEEPVPLKLFNVKPSALNAGPLFASGDGVTAVWVSGEQWAALGNPPATALVERVACRQWTLVGDCPDGFRGIWGQDALA